VKSRTDNTSDIVLHHRPKNPMVAITAKEITIKQQIQFATDSATILPASDGLLTEIADVFIHNPRIRRVEIQGHTDSEGADDHNQILSDERANSVRTWLVQHGVGADRLVAKGYGEKKPLVPNVTPAARQRNRRVQFVILEQDPAATK
jgi:outer membrane protein OmpA-like peptidoglycan-associated protein